MDDSIFNINLTMPKPKNAPEGLRKKKNSGAQGGGAKVCGRTIVASTNKLAKPQKSLMNELATELHWEILHCKVTDHDIYPW